MLTKMVFLTNSHINEVGEFLNTLPDTNRIVARKPQATESYTTSKLLEMQMVGLYRLNEGEAYHCEEERWNKLYARDEQSFITLPDPE